MEEIINKVIEIDTSAKQFIKSAEDKKANLDDYVKNESVKIEKEINSLMENNLAKEQIRLDKHLEEKKKSIAENTEAELNRLSEFESSNKDRLMDEVYNNIVMKNEG
ncbi:MAG: hypothetical protein FWC53_02495 [Firmicutes bacterium]|nr:hypothetical protein [Bacillota bacterium]